MHSIYTTDAFVLKSAPSREADKRYYLFTRELGLLRSSAQGVRLLRSKLRFSLQDFSLSSVSVVRGREVWRITNARLISNIFLELESKKDDTVTRLAFARIFKLLVRLLPEEEPQKKLFDDLSNAIDFANMELLSIEDVHTLECVLALKILSYLGYVGDTAELSPFLPALWTKELLSAAGKERKRMIVTINNSLHHSHL